MKQGEPWFAFNCQVIKPRREGEQPQGLPPAAF